MGKHRLSKCLKEKKFPSIEENEEALEALQMKLLRIQQGIWHQKGRAILVFEGFDAAGKGGAIRVITEKLDPRGVHVHPIGPPTDEEKSQHYLARFWSKLPEPGTIAIFDRSWYGRVMVERVDEITPPERWKEAYGEINDFERMLVNDGIDVIKFFLAIHPEVQLERFEQRLKDPAKQWKLGDPDLRAHELWDDYVEAVDEMIDRTDTKEAPWVVVQADSKPYARGKVLETVNHRLGRHRKWMEESMALKHSKDLKQQLAKLKKASRK